MVEAFTVTRSSSGAFCATGTPVPGVLVPVFTKRSRPSACMKPEASSRATSTSVLFAAAMRFENRSHPPSPWGQWSAVSS